MNSEQYEMTFGEWLQNAKHEDVKLNSLGCIDWQEERKEQLYERWYEEWHAERKAYIFQNKNEKITHALEALRAKGYEAVLRNYDNAHITATSKSGKIMSYYATTGTIVGYYDTAINGIDDFIRLLGDI